MKVELLIKKSGEYITMERVSEFMNGHKWYWLEYEDGESQKFPTDKYQLLSVEA